MSKIQETLDSLQPYVIGIRYVEGTPLVDVVFKDGWALATDTKIKTVKGNDELNYYMLFSEVKTVGLDELLAFVDKTIKLNIEREKKHELLRQKVNDLKEIWKKNTLSKLKNLKFVFGDEDLMPNLKEFDIDEFNIDEEEPTSVEEPIIESPFNYVEEHVDNDSSGLTNVPAFLDENHNPIQMTEEDLELLEEEKRAETNRKIIENRKNKVSVKPVTKVELPPKKILETITSNDYDSGCDCGDDEACDKCINYK